MDELAKMDLVEAYVFHQDYYINGLLRGPEKEKDNQFIKYVRHANNICKNILDSILTTLSNMRVSIICLNNGSQELLNSRNLKYQMRQTPSQ